MRAGVWGSPIEHSLSPALHRAAYTALELGWRYDLRDVEADALPAAVAALGPDVAGLSLTMPLKAAVLPLLAEVSPLARAVGAVNTVLPLRPGRTGSPLSPLAWRGENTDVAGIVAALAEVGVVRAGSAVVLGGGATAASAVAALARLGVREPVVRVRSPERAAGLVAVGARCGAAVHLAPWDDAASVAAEVCAADVVVSTAPAGAADVVAEAVAARAAAPRGALLDVVYAPWPTALASAWTASGARAASGFAMLVHQAAAQVELMTGRPAPLAAMRAAGEAELAARLTAC